MGWARGVCLAVWLASAPAAASVEVVDDLGQSVRLAQPARRIVSLAPHATELLYAAGAGDKLVGASAYSDYPPAAKTLPRVGSSSGVDLERLLALKPDLVVAWSSGSGADRIAQLKSLGLTVFVSEPRRLDDVATTLERFGALAGTEPRATSAARDFRARFQALAERYSGRPPVRVFYEIWDKPLMTVNGEHLISQVIRLCGGENVFAELPALAAAVSVEAVLAANPEAIAAGTAEGSEAAWRQGWRRWESLRAVQAGNLFALPYDLMQRHSPRILDGAEQLCRDLETARSRR